MAGDSVSEIRGPEGLLVEPFGACIMRMEGIMLKAL